MLAHEKKVALKKGEKVAKTYVPRAEHPLLQKARPPPGPVAAEEDEDNGALDKALKADEGQQQQQTSAS
jgi:hypothetical protein